MATGLPGTSLPGWHNRTELTNHVRQAPSPLQRIHGNLAQGAAPVVDLLGSLEGFHVLVTAVQLDADLLDEPPANGVHAIYSVTVLPLHNGRSVGCARSTSVR